MSKVDTLSNLVKLATQAAEFQAKYEIALAEIENPILAEQLKNKYDTIYNALHLKNESAILNANFTEETHKQFSTEIGIAYTHPVFLCESDKFLFKRGDDDA